MIKTQNKRIHVKTYWDEGGKSLFWDTASKTTITISSENYGMVNQTQILQSFVRSDVAYSVKNNYP